jgi:hypothetical protein
VQVSEAVLVYAVQWYYQAVIVDNMDFTCAEYIDMHFVYGEMQGNTEASCRQYA